MARDLAEVANFLDPCEVRTLCVFPADEADEEDLEEEVAVAVVAGLELTYFLFMYLRVQCCSLSSSMARLMSPALVIVSELGM